MAKKKPLIRQAGSAEAFVDSTATGREHNKVYHMCIGLFKKNAYLFLDGFCIKA